MSQAKIRRDIDERGSQPVFQCEEMETNGTVEVLYQKMGDRWFAFSLIDDEVFVGSITQDELDAVETAPTRLHPIAGNS